GTGELVQHPVNALGERGRGGCPQVDVPLGGLKDEVGHRLRQAVKVGIDVEPAVVHQLLDQFVPAAGWWRAGEDEVRDGAEAEDVEEDAVGLRVGEAIRRQVGRGGGVGQGVEVPCAGDVGALGRGAAG